MLKNYNLPAPLSDVAFSEGAPVAVSKGKPVNQDHNENFVFYVDPYGYNVGT